MVVIASRENACCFTGQREIPTGDMRSVEKKAQHEHIKSSADEVICYHRGCMQRRNRYMVDHSSVCICYQTQDTGGTVSMLGNRAYQ